MFYCMVPSKENEQLLFKRHKLANDCFSGKVFFFFNLAAWGPSCDMWDPHCSTWTLVAELGLSCPVACGILVPLPGVNPYHLHCRAYS